MRTSSSTVVSRMSCGLWAVALDAWGIQIAVPDSPTSLLRMWLHTLVTGKFMRNLWKMAFFAIIWSIWVARNCVVFEEGSWIIQAVSFKAKILLGSWIKIWNQEFQYSPEDVARVFNHLALLG